MIRKVVLRLLFLYKFFISPSLKVILGKGCKFNPTCSEYAHEAISKYGLFIGTKMAIRRVARCHPMNTDLYFDPVP